MQDKTLTCRDFGSKFMFTASEMEFFAQCGKDMQCHFSPVTTDRCIAPTVSPPSVPAAGVAVAMAAVVVVVVAVVVEVVAGKLAGQLLVSN